MPDPEGPAWPPDAWAVVGALTEPQRRAVYEAVCARLEPSTREDVAAGVGISRSLAAFHLDKLVDAGVLEAAEAPSPGRGRRKIGRPAKRYRRSGRQIDVTVPARRYELAGRMLAAALAATSAGEPPDEAARRIARQHGRALAGELGGRAVGGRTEPLDTAGESLRRLGYSPVEAGDELVLTNCPFHALVETAPELTCGMNLAFIEGLLAGLEVSPGITARLAPRPDGCCVSLSVGRE